MSRELEIFLSLDFTDLGRALRTAFEAYRAGIRSIEVGTPLIKSHGMLAVRAVRAAFPDAKIFADTKTVDTGSLEASLAFGSGADVVSVLATAPRETISSAVEEAESRGKAVLVDTIGLEGRDLEGRVEEAANLGVEMVCLHAGIDQGTFSGWETLPRLRREGLLVGAAGGIDSEAIRALRGVADFVMVGRAITRAGDPYSAALRVVRAARG